MGKERYSIVYSSSTGNTKKLADTIYAVLAKENCDYFGGPKEGGLYSEMLYIGFWTDKGNADKSTLTLLSTLKNKKIFLFGTAGLWRQRGIFPEDSQSCQAVYRFKQFRGRRIYVSGQNAAVCTGTLHENEGTAGASGKYRCAD